MPADHVRRGRLAVKCLSRAPTRPVPGLVLRPMEKGGITAVSDVTVRRRRPPACDDRSLGSFDPSSRRHAHIGRKLESQAPHPRAGAGHSRPFQPRDFVECRMALLSGARQGLPAIARTSTRAKHGKTPVHRLTTSFTAEFVVSLSGPQRRFAHASHRRRHGIFPVRRRSQ